jgi:CO dehydrogenase nickel-insertion accessory protein CooC1
MRVIAVCGQSGSGKSSLCFSFSKFLQKRGISCAIANFDPAAKRPPYSPDFDIRKHFPAKAFSKKAGGNQERACELALLEAIEDKRVWRELRDAGTEVTLLDLRAPLDSLLFAAGKSVLEHADKVVYVADASRASDYALFEKTCALLSSACEKPVVPVLNKAESVKRAKSNLFAPSRDKPESVVFASAIERRGFDDLARQIA